MQRNETSKRCLFVLDGQGWRMTAKHRTKAIYAEKTFCEGENLCRTIRRAGMAGALFYRYPCSAVARVGATTRNRKLE